MQTSDNRLLAIAQAVRAALVEIRQTLPVRFRANIENELGAILAAIEELERAALDGIANYPPIDTENDNRLDYLDAVIADAAGRRFALTDGERVLYIETFGAVDVRTILDAEMQAGERSAEATSGG